MRDGYDVLTAEDGEEGLALLRENHIDLVITDLKMPRVDGMTLLKRAIEEEPELPVVVITAHGTIDTAVEALKLGAFDFVTKPFDKDELRQIVAKALKTRELRGADATPARPRRRPIRDHRYVCGHRRALCDSRARRRPTDDSPHHGRERDWQGAGRTRPPRALRAKRQTVHQGQLRSHSQGAHRKRALWL